MTTDITIEVGIHEKDQLYVVPSKSSFSYIYREAMEVHWSPEIKCLYSPKPREWDDPRWYKQIISAAVAQNTKLEVNEATIWTNVPEELKERICGNLD